ncbi:MAG: hypothetical protein AB7G93_04830 [Bdellovibrionales bacterium]
MRNLFIIFVLIFAFKAFGEGVEEGKKGRVGPGKAVIEASEKEGLRISEKALKNLDLEFVTASNGAALTVPMTALVHFQDFSAIYRERGGWFKMIEIEPVIRGSTALFTSKDISPGDRIVTRNSGFIRVIDLDVFGPEADACAD